ncbi:MAG: hypothetical protein JO160_03690 [Candidatus Eremiobacteraeota bacterium]|nr:hypothetical protein [Candidatus Eremiobacteraeota bacterium]
MYHTLMKRAFLGVFLAAVSLAMPLGRQPAAAQTDAAPATRDGSGDFAFEYGTWRTHYRLLRKRLANDRVWYDCYGTSQIRPFWGGQGNLEDGDLQCPTKYVGGLTVRTYDAKTHQWTIWWATKQLGIVPPPQVGHFDDRGTGNFFARDLQEGKHVIIRFRWTHPGSKPHFEQAFSADNGKTWETNWTTDYSRVSPSSKGVWNAVAPAGDGHDGFDFLLGTWRTHYERLRHPLANDREWFACEGHSSVTAFWGGAGNIEDGDLHCPGGAVIRGVTVRVYRETTHQWQLWWGTTASGLLTPPQVGAFDAAGVGIFDAPDTWHGRPIVVRYKWTTRDGTPYYEQSFSPDGGRTWETNWTTVYAHESAPVRSIR